MNKQKLAFRFGFAAVLFTSLLSTSIRVNAGPQPITIIDSGDSSSSAGDNFSSGASGKPPVVAAGLRGVVQFTENPDGTITITVPPAIQAKLDGLAANMRTNPRVIAGREVPGAAEQTTVFIVMTNTNNGTETAQTVFVKGLQESGVSSGSAQALANKMAFLLASDNVNITQVNEAIILYNKIVIESKGPVLVKLAKDKNFRELRQRLVAFVNALK
ncbi:MAG: hypothetical protein QNJ51_14415 [Calothrix sp. MO_167.B12]|nr:hypothetical protein [Calothrix sp. MO_167.B12]